MKRIKKVHLRLTGTIGECGYYTDKVTQIVKRVTCLLCKGIMKRKYK